MNWNTSPTKHRQKREICRSPQSPKNKHTKTTHSRPLLDHPFKDKSPTVDYGSDSSQKIRQKVQVSQWPCQARISNRLVLHLPTQSRGGTMPRQRLQRKTRRRKNSLRALEERISQPLIGLEGEGLHDSRFVAGLSDLDRVVGELGEGLVMGDHDDLANFEVGEHHG